MGAAHRSAGVHDRIAGLWGDLTTNASELFELAQHGLLIALYVALPLLGAAVAAGVAVSAVQSALRQSDPTLSVVPRMLAAGGALLIFGGWMVAVLGGFWIELWGSLPEMMQ